MMGNKKHIKTWRGYNILDLCLISIGIISVTISGVLFQSKWYVIISSLLGVLCVFTQAKGKIATQFIGIVYFAFYIFVSYTQKYYGEAILYLTIMIPLYIYGIIHWLANRDKKDNVVIVRSNLPLKEWILAGIILIFVSVGVYFTLKSLNTNQLAISSLSFISMLPAVYLLTRRCKWNQVAFLFNDFVLITLWLCLILKGDYSFLPVSVCHIFQVTYDIYGLKEWIKLEKKQQAENI